MPPVEESWEVLRDRLYAFGQGEGLTPQQKNLCLEALQHPRWEVVAEAIHALRKGGPDQVAARAVGVLATHSQYVVRQVVARTLGVIGTAQDMPLLETMLHDESPVVRKRAAEAIANLWTLGHRVS